MPPTSLKEQLLKWREKHLSPSRGGRSRSLTATGNKPTPIVAKQSGQDDTPNSTHNPIREFVESRQIMALYHFTPGVNVGGILDLGILPRSELKPGPEGSAPIFNDPNRADHCLDASCCTIGFPNYKTFYSYQQREKNRIWAVIVINPTVLWSNRCLFNQTNAANTECSRIRPKERATVGSLKAMFADRTSRSDSLDSGGEYSYLSKSSKLHADRPAG